MRWVMLAVMAGLVAGCGQTPMAVREAGRLQVVALRGDYKVAANCVLGSFVNQTGLTTNVIWRDDRRGAEVIAKYDGQTLYVVDVQESAGRSVGTTYTSELTLSGSERVVELVKPCG